MKAAESTLAPLFVPVHVVVDVVVAEVIQVR
jgi:hypothetical protein